MMRIVFLLGYKVVDSSSIRGEGKERGAGGRNHALKAEHFTAACREVEVKGKRW